MEKVVIIESVIIQAFELTEEVHSLSRVQGITVLDIMNPLVSTAKVFIADKAGLSRKSMKEMGLHQAEKLVLKDVSSFINLKGVLKGKFVVSMDQQLVKAIVKNFVAGGMAEEEVDEYIEDTLAECSNIILGNSIKLFPGIEDYVFIDSPQTMTCKYAAFRYSEMGIWTCCIDCGCGSLSVSIITSDIAA